MKSLCIWFYLSVMIFGLSHFAEGQSNQPIDGLCNNEERYTCVLGELAFLEEGLDYFQWKCLGLDGGAEDLCYQEKSEMERQEIDNRMKVVREAFIIRRSKTSHFEERANTQYVTERRSVVSSSVSGIQVRLVPVEEVIEGIDNPDIIRLFEITNEADQILKESCGVFDTYCLPYINNLWFSDIEYSVLEWASISYDERQSEGEPEGMEESNVSEPLQRLIEITKEKDQIITDWERSNY